jgi:hypothetical protein
MLALNEATAQPWVQTGNSIITSTDYLGCDFSSIFPLNLKTRANQPIDFSTADLFRARINPKMSYAIGTEPTDARDGFMLLSGRDNFPQQVKGPFTRLHLVDDVGANNPTTYAQEIGYRGWMRNGITFTGNSDQAYIGQKYAGDDNTGVVKWRYLPPSSNTCDWELNSGGQLLTTGWRAPGTNGNSTHAGSRQPKSPTLGGPCVPMT